MSALNFMLSDQEVIIATDSLASDVDLTPASFQTKLFPLSHVNGVICGTGLVPIILDWFVVVQRQVIARNVVYLSELAPSVLSGIAPKYEDVGAGTTTVYHFGWDETRGRFRGFAHRSANGYQKEEFPRPHWALKPGSEELLKLFENTFDRSGDLATCFIETIKAQRIRDMESPTQDRVGIGGEVHLMNMTQGHQFMWNCYRFDDYDESYKGMLRRRS